MYKKFLMFGDDLSIYKEIPVDIDTFVESDYFIGKYTMNGKSIFPYWRNVLRKIFDPTNPNLYHEMFNASAIGTGKTFISVIAFSYTLYCHMCVNDLNDFLGFAVNDTISFVIASVGNTYTNRLRDCFLGCISDSIWFNLHGTFGKNSYCPIDKRLKIITASKESDIFGVQTVGSLFQWLCDKYDNKNTYGFYCPVLARIKSRNSKFGKVIVDFELSNDYNNIGIVTNKSSQDDVLITKDSQFMIKPQGTFDYSDSFYVVYDGYIGHCDIIYHSKPILNNPKASNYLKDKFKFISCPINFLETAKLDVDLFLLRVCGIQLKPEENTMTFLQALDELKNGKAISIDGSNRYFVIENDLIYCYVLDSNKLIKVSETFQESFGEDVNKYFKSGNWISFDVPLKE